MSDAPMASGEFDAALAELGWSDPELSRRLGCDRSLPGKWRNNPAAMPPPVAEWLRARAAAGAAHPPPPWPVRKNKPRTPRIRV